MQYSRDQVLKMAPDDASAKAGQQLANSAKWAVRSINEKALWGDCQGSGKLPYKAIVDLTNIAFKCSCPSRKFPCKHGLGLMLLYTQQPDLFSKETVLPDYVAEWLDKRAQKETAQEEKQAKPVDEAAKAKRAEQRERKVSGGIEEVRAWIRDIVRTGIMNIPQNSYQFNQNITARMVDAQAGGLANQLRQLNKINFYQDGWQKALIRRLSLIYLLTESYSRLDELPDMMVQEIRTLIGWTTAKEALLQTQATSDSWTILSLTITDESNIATERIWLYGSNSKRYALLLNFYAGGLTPQHLLVPGMQVKADLVFFPGLAGHRALIKEQQATIENAGWSIAGPTTISNIYEQVTNTLAQNPFMEQMPFSIGAVRLVFEGAVWLMVDIEHKAMVISNPASECWLMLAFTKGKAFSGFGIYENEQVQLHYISANGKNYVVK